jgi:hypothetical protein
LDAAGVEDPEAVFGVEDYALYADEVVLIVCACGRCGSVVDCTAGWAVDLSTWIWRLRRVAGKFSDLIFIVTPGIGVVGI